MSANIKLTYFNGRWIAEVTRFLLKYGNVEFEDCRIQQKDWSKIKPTVPFGTLPIYEEDGKVISQSVAIARHVAKKVGLTGATDWENLEIDSIVDTINDLKKTIIGIFEEKDDKKKQKLKETHVTETIPFYLGKLETIAERNGGFLVAGKLTWADFFFTTTSDIFQVLLGEDVVRNYPYLVEVKENVLNLPEIKSWIDSRPEINCANFSYSQQLIMSLLKQSLSSNITRNILRDKKRAECSLFTNSYLITHISRLQLYISAILSQLSESSLDMTPSTKITYFDIKGLGEPIRLLLKYGQIEFEDIRISREDWPQIKPTTPFGQVPIYEENGKVIWQSLAICRYLGRKVNLSGENEWEELEIDAVVDTYKDLSQKIGEYGRETDPERKERLREVAFEQIIPFYLERLDVIAESNNGYLALKKLTWADIYFFTLSEGFSKMHSEIFEQYTNLVKVRENVQEILQTKGVIE
ncbi:putative glutathione S-transferase, C-terminal domain [Trypoxylus dichotomus]